MAATPDIVRIKHSTDSEASIVAAIAPGSSHPITRGELVLGIETGQAKLYALDSTNVPVPVVSGYPFGIDGGDFDAGSFPVLNGSLLPRLGTTATTSYDGWTKVYDSGESYSYTYYALMNFNIVYNGTTYNRFYVNPNCSITFGAANTSTFLSLTSPYLNKILLEAGYGNIQKLYIQSNSAYYRFRFEGRQFGSIYTGQTNLIYEMTIINPAYTNDQLIELRAAGTGFVNRTTQPFAIASESAAFASEPDILPGESWVFEGDKATGQTWTMTPYKYIDT